MLKELTKAQKSAVCHTTGPCLVLAGPGSGKTFVITGRIIHLIKECKVPGERILVLTFTRAAAMEMESRFQKEMSGEHPWFGTFHSLFYYILSKSDISDKFQKTDLSVSGRFISVEDKKRILTSAYELASGKKQEVNYELLEKAFSLYLNCGLKASNNFQESAYTEEVLQNIYKEYHKILLKSGYMDFDDMMMECYHMLKEHSQIRAYWRRRFDYILIDECQDMNPVQYEIMKYLTGKEGNIFMVGDDDQSIYRFRGAKVELMQLFTEEFHDVKRIQLDMNFRSVPDIVHKSQKVIGQNKNRFPKQIYAASKQISKDGSGVDIKSFVSRSEMYESILDALLKVQKEELEQTAIIYRTNKELRSMAYKLRNKGISYVTIEEKKSIFEENWYLDIEAYMKLALGTWKRADLLRVCNKPERGIYRSDLIHTDKLPDKLAKDVKQLIHMKPFLAFQYIWYGIGYGKWLENHISDHEEEWNWIKEQYQELQIELKGYHNLEDWIRHVETDRNRQRILRQKKSDPLQGINAGGVHLLSMHGSKGLEFDTVYLPDVNKGKIPKGSKMTVEELEEERRLFYVAMTRAKKYLHIFYVKGEKDHIMQPSVFLKPIL